MQFHPNIHAVATAVPTNCLKQADVKAWARRQFENTSSKTPAHVERLMGAFDNAGIETHYSCVPLDWYDTRPGWREKNRLYLQHASALAADAAARCLQNAGKTADEIDCLISVSTSGIATPSLDARLLTDLGMRADVLRLPVFGLGCAGGVMGLARAADMARAEPGRLVLLIVVELCGLTFRSSDQSKSNIVAIALFGDGAAAVLLSVPADRREAKLPMLSGWGEHTWPDSFSVMLRHGVVGRR